MNDADLMAGAYALYAQNLAAYGTIDKANIIGQIQNYFSANAVRDPPSSLSAVSSNIDKSNGMDAGSDRSATDDGVRPACRFCGKTFAQASYIKAHERLHTGEKPYGCTVCGKAFSDASNWKKHERMHSRQLQSAVEEGVLPLVTSAPTTPERMTPTSPIMSLPLPQLTVHGTPPTQMSVASSQNQNNQNSQTLQLPVITPPLQLQINVPEPPSPRETDTPGPASENNADLSPPIKRNKEEGGMITCNMCDKSFSTPASLSMHKKIHSGERPHCCGICGKSFTQIGTLRAHERVHTGEKPYECNFCGKTFAQCGSFRMHERRHHRDIMETWQKCYVCGASFSTAEELQKHLLCHPGALNLNLQPGGLGFPQLPMNFSMLHESAEHNDHKAEPNKSEPSFDLKEFNKAFHAYTNPPRSAPVTASFSDHFNLPPFASTAHALIHRSLSQGSSPSAVSMLLASNGAEGMNLFNHAYTASALLSPTHLHPPLIRPEPGLTQQPQQQLETTPKTEGVEEVSTTTRSRKYSSDSHTSLSLPDAPSDNNISQLDLSKSENDTEAPNQSQKTPSEDSSLNESRSEDFQSDEPHSGISRKNLNKKLISSRKQRHPMRRLSTSGSLQGDFSSKTEGDGDAEVDQEGLEEAEKMSRDQMLVTFLLNRGDVYKCEHCHIIFEDCTLYLVHNGFHANDSDPFKCVICKKMCDGRIEFNLHLTSHIK